MNSDLTRDDFRSLEYVLDKLKGNPRIQKHVLKRLLSNSSMNSTIKQYLKNSKNEEEQKLTPKQMIEKEEEMRPVYDEKRKTLIKSLGGITTGNPVADLGIRVGLSAANNFSKAGANIFRDNGNQLAAALLASKRTSQKKEDKYGKTFDSVGKDRAASERIRRGNKYANVLNAVGNIAGDAGRLFGGPLDAAGMMTAGQATNLPGHAYNWMNGVLGRSHRASQNLGV